MIIIKERNHHHGLGKENKKKNREQVIASRDPNRLVVRYTAQNADLKWALSIYI